MKSNVRYLQKMLAPSGRSRVVAVCAASLLAVVFYWLGYHLTVYNSADGMSYFTNEYQVYPHEIAASQDLSALAFEPHQGRFAWQTCAAPCYFVARFTIVPTAVDQGDEVEDWGFVPSYNTENFRVLLNGVTLEAKGQLEPELSFHGKRSWLTRLPKELLLPNQANQVDVLLVRAAKPAVVQGAFVGSYADLQTGLEQRFFFYYDWPRYMALVGLMLAALVLLALPAAMHRDMLSWFVVVTASWALLSLYRLWFDFPGSYEVRGAYYFALQNLVYMSLFQFFCAWSGRKERVLRWGAAGLYAAILGVFFLLEGQVERKEVLLSDPFQILMVLGLVVLAVRHYVQLPELRIVESAAWFVVISSALLDVLAQVMGVFDFYSLPRTLPVFVVAVAASLFYRNVRLFESEREINEVLEAKLVQREEELEQVHAREQARERQRILGDERQRILQDMHDGVGGRLAALLESQSAQPDADRALTRELQQSLQDLLLVIDSLDPELNEDLGSALGALRMRITPWLNEHNLSLVWGVNLPQQLALGPERTLHVYRCIQEAVSNVVRHANAKKVWISANCDADWVNVTVADDGVGLGEGDLGEGGLGRGISNMHSRMQGVGGTVQFSGERGVIVVFALPIDQPLPATAKVVSVDQPADQSVDQTGSVSNGKMRESQTAASR